MSSMSENAKAKLLLVDDEPIKRTVMVDELREAGYAVVAVGNPLEAESHLKEGWFDVVLTDLRMPGQDGLSFLRELKAKRPEQSVLVMTAYGTVETAVEAMKAGAYDYLEKPFSTEELLIKLSRLLQYEGLSRENEALRKALAPRPGETRIVGQSEVMRALLARVHVISSSDTSVLIQGESGTGKELFARLIHETSCRASGPFVAVSCAVLPRELMEAELFGHEPGAFTGAAKRRIGRFELAHGGTFFMDDVDDIPLDVQVKLVRVLQERSFERVGGETTVRANIRVVAATKKDLAAMAAAGTFREDLYYRLNVVPLCLPPLRERMDDLPVLVGHFVEKAALKLNRPTPTFAASAFARMATYHWPGNVRELEHFVERVLALTPKAVIEAEDVPVPAAPTDSCKLVSLTLDTVPRIDLASVLADVEGRMIRWALNRESGNLARAAEILGVPRSTLQYKVSKLVPPPPSPRRDG